MFAIAARPLLAVSALIVALVPGSPARQESPTRAELRVIESGPARVVLELTGAPVQLIPWTANGVTYTQVTMPGLPSAGAGGAPQLPVAATLVGIPPGAGVTLHASAGAGVSVTLEQPVLPSPAPQVEIDPLDALPHPARLRYTPDLAFYGADDSPSPGMTASMDGPFSWRSQRVVRLRIFPVQAVDHARGLVVHEQVRVELRFTYPADLTASFAMEAIDEGPFETVLQTSLANYTSARGWRIPAPVTLSTGNATTAAAAAPLAAGEAPWYRVAVDDPGLYELGCARLAAAGADLGELDLTTVRLYAGGQQGTELALQIEDADSDSRCDPEHGDAVIFYGEATASKYTAHNIYWLTYGAAIGKRMRRQESVAGATPVAALSHTVHLEQNRLYFSYIPLEDGADHWYGEILSPYTGVSHTYTVPVNALPLNGDEAGSQATVVVALSGFDGDHRTQVQVNHVPVHESTWSGRVAREISLTLPITTLVEGANTVQVAENGGAGDYAYINFVELTYTRALHATDDSLRISQPSPGAWRYVLKGFTTPEIEVYDISDPANVQQANPEITFSSCPCAAVFAAQASGPRTYLALTPALRLAPASIQLDRPSDLHAVANGADYLVIAHASLMAAVEPLAAHRAAQGLRVRIVDVQDIYDEFSGGLMDARALSSFLSYTYASWTPPAPAFVLLVGDGSYDGRGYLVSAAHNLIPPWMGKVDSWLGETASDNRLVAFDPVSNLPQMAIGRLPATNEAEAAAMVDKILHYEAQPPAVWQRQLTFVADNAYSPGGVQDPAGNFWALADALASSPALPFPFEVERLYLNLCDGTQLPACAPPYRTYSDGPSLTAALIDSWNAGRLLVTYIGHGAPTSWAGNPTLFTAADLAGLHDGARLPVTLDLTCYTGYFQFPQLTTLAEALLRRPDGGAVGAWASSGQGVTGGHAALAGGFFGALARGADRLGLAAVAGKIYLFTTGDGAYAESIDTFHLFGDPALHLPLPSTPTPKPTPEPTSEPTAKPTPEPASTLAATPAQTPSPPPTAVPLQTATPAMELSLPFIGAP